MAAWLSWVKSRWFHIALAAWTLSTVLVCIRVARHPGSHSAFRGVRTAGIAWLHQGRLYGADTGFLYTPLIAGIHSPFALLPEAIAEVLWRVMIGVGFPLVLWFNARALFRFSRDQFASLLLLTLPLTLNTLNNGQSNIVLVVLCLGATAAAAHARWWLCAACAAFAIYWKVYPIALALLLTVVFPKKLGVRIVVCVIVLFVVSLLLQAPQYVVDQYHRWIATLISDPRREIDYYGKNRDFYLLLRVVGIPITTLWWTVLQLLTAACAAVICLFGRIRNQTLLFGLMCLAIAWMLLFGPATEATTYVLIAVPSAYLVLLGWFRQSGHTAFSVSIAAYVGFIFAEVVNSWLGIKQYIYLVHAVQPAVALCFCAALFCWWKEQAYVEHGAPLSLADR